MASFQDGNSVYRAQGVNLTTREKKEPWIYIEFSGYFKKKIYCGGAVLVCFRIKISEVELVKSEFRVSGKSQNPYSNVQML